MSNDIQLFDHPEFGQIRVVTNSAGEPLFISKDVCACLELSDPHTSLALLDEDEKGWHTVPTLGGPQQMAVVSEPGLYSLILRSRKPEAKVFKRWVTHDVLPSIRKTGSYCIAGIPVPNFDNPAAIARAWADMYEAKLEADKQTQLAIEARDYAIATKGRIVAGRDQRLMQQRHDDMRTIRRKDERNGKLEAMYAEQGIELGAERMRADKAEDALGCSKTYLCTTNIRWFPDYFDFKNFKADSIRSQAGKQLKALSDEKGYKCIEVPGHRYPVKAYHVDVIAAFRLRLDQNPKLMEKWRKHD